jgi:hypothetical protein
MLNWPPDVFFITDGQASLHDFSSKFQRESAQKIRKSGLARDFAIFDLFWCFILLVLNNFSVNCIGM